MSFISHSKFSLFLSEGYPRNMSCHATALIFIFRQVATAYKLYLSNTMLYMRVTNGEDDTGSRFQRFYSLENCDTRRERLGKKQHVNVKSLHLQPRYCRQFHY